MTLVPEIPPALRDDLLTYLFCSSPDRARIIAELLARTPRHERATGRVGAHRGAVRLGLGRSAPLLP
jgi:hypothetical protein